MSRRQCDLECSVFWLLKAPSALTVIHVQVITPGGDRCFCQSGIIRTLNTLPAETTGGQRSRASFLGLELRLRSAISGVTDVPESPVRRAERSQRSQHSVRSEPTSVVQSGGGFQSLAGTGPVRLEEARDEDRNI